MVLGQQSGERLMVDVLEGLQYMQQQGELGRQRGAQSRLGRLVSQAYGAPRDQQDSLVQQAMATDPGTGFKLSEALGKREQIKMEELGKYASIIDSLPEEQKASAYPQIAQEMNTRGIPVPTEWHPEMGKMISRFAQTYGQDSGANGVQSTFVDQSGNRNAVMRDGSIRVLGQAENRYQLRDQPGLPPGAFDPRTGTIRAVQEASAGQQGGMPYAIDPSLPPQVQAAIRSNEVEWANAPDGATASIPPSGAAAARPAINPAEAARLRLAEEANARAAQAAEEARQTRALGNAPAGFRFKPDGSLEPIPGGPKPAGAAASEDERKAAAWLAQAQNAYSNMAGVLREDANADNPGIIETYSPIDELGNRSRSDTRQRYVQASESLGEALLRAATGAGINEHEARQKVNELTPKRGDSDAVKQQKLAAIPVYLQALTARAGRAAPGVQQGQSSPSAPKRLKYNPATGRIE